MRNELVFAFSKCEDFGRRLVQTEKDSEVRRISKRHGQDITCGSGSSCPHLETCLEQGGSRCMCCQEAQVWTEQLKRTTSMNAPED